MKKLLATVMLIAMIGIILVLLVQEGIITKDSKVAIAVNEGTGWFSHLWDHVAGWLANAYHFAVERIHGLWNRSSEWVDHTMDPFVRASEKLVGKENGFDNTDGLLKAIISLFNDVAGFDNSELLNSLKTSSSNAIDKIKGHITTILNKLGCDISFVEEIWDEVEQFSNDKEVEILDSAKLALAYVSGLNPAQFDEATSITDLPKIMLSEHFTEWLIELNVTDEESAEQFIKALIKVLDDH